MTEYLVKAEVEELWDAFRAECLAALNRLGNDGTIEQVEQARIDAGARGAKAALDEIYQGVGRQLLRAHGRLVSRIDELERIEIPEPQH